MLSLPLQWHPLRQGYKRRLIADSARNWGALDMIACRGPLVFLGCFIHCRDTRRHLMAVVLQHLAKIARIEVGAAERQCSLWTGVASEGAPVGPE
jgi:hypothetical protein